MGDNEMFNGFRHPYGHGGIKIVGEVAEDIEISMEEIEAAASEECTPMMKELRLWSSVLKQKRDIPGVHGTHFDWRECEWLPIGMPRRILDNELMFALIEYCADKEPQTGISQIVVDKEQLEEYFYIAYERQEVEE